MQAITSSQTFSTVEKPPLLSEPSSECMALVVLEVHNHSTILYQYQPRGPDGPVAKAPAPVSPG